MAFSNEQDQQPPTLEVIDGKGRRKAGRISADGQEETFDPRAAKELLPELERAFVKLKDAREAYSDVVKKFAERSKGNSSAVRQYMTHRMADTLVDLDRHLTQVSQYMLDLGEKSS